MLDHLEIHNRSNLQAILHTKILLQKTRTQNLQSPLKIITIQIISHQSSLLLQKHPQKYFSIAVRRRKRRFNLEQLVNYRKSLKTQTLAIEGYTSVLRVSKQRAYKILLKFYRLTVKVV